MKHQEVQSVLRTPLSPRSMDTPKLEGMASINLHWVSHENPELPTSTNTAKNQGQQGYLPIPHKHRIFVGQGRKPTKNRIWAIF